MSTLNIIGTPTAGLGVGEWEIGYEILASAAVDCVLLAGRYTLLDQTALTSGFLDACRRRGAAVLAAGVFSSGFLAGRSMYQYRQADEEMRRRRERLAADLICAEAPTPAMS